MFEGCIPIVSEVGIRISGQLMLIQEDDLGGFHEDGTIS
jgi:hypothetical protein